MSEAILCSVFNFHPEILVVVKYKKYSFSIKVHHLRGHSLFSFLNLTDNGGNFMLCCYLLLLFGLREYFYMSGHFMLCTVR